MAKRSNSFWSLCVNKILLQFFFQSSKECLLLCQNYDCENVQWFAASKKFVNFC